MHSDGTILGEVQWKWLESELRNSDAQIHIFGSSIQVRVHHTHFSKVHIRVVILKAPGETFSELARRCKHLRALGIKVCKFFLKPQINMQK